MAQIATGEVTIPTLVIHGLDDTLIAPGGDERTAALIPGAHRLLFGDMGHDGPAPLWPQICGAILRHTESRRARRPPQDGALADRGAAFRGPA